MISTWSREREMAVEERERERERYRRGGDGMIDRENNMETVNILFNKAKQWAHPEQELISDDRDGDNSRL